MRLVGGAIALGVAVAVIWGATEASAQQINACVNTSSGALKIVAAGTPCAANETLLTWNVTGPAGPPGSQGPAGPAGPQGPQGPAGVLAFTEYLCNEFTPSGQDIACGAFVSGGGGVGVSTAPQTQFLVQPGLYEIQLNGQSSSVGGNACGWVALVINGGIDPFSFGPWQTCEGGIGADGTPGFFAPVQIVPVTAANTVISLLAQAAAVEFTTRTPVVLILTKLQ